MCRMQSDFPMNFKSRIKNSPWCFAGWIIEVLWNAVLWNPSCPSIEQETRRSFKLETDQFICICFWYNFCRKKQYSTDSRYKPSIWQALRFCSQHFNPCCFQSRNQTLPFLGLSGEFEGDPIRPDRKDWDWNHHYIVVNWWWFRRWRSCMLWTNCQNGQFLGGRYIFCHYNCWQILVGFLQLQLF